MCNLKDTQRVEKYIPPSLKPAYHKLQDQAYKLRHIHGFFNTRIDYTPEGITLLTKKQEDSSWVEFN